MEYDFETGSEDEVILREAQKIHNRLPQGGLYNAITPLVRLILALFAALGARTAQEALERINAMKIARDEARREVETKRQHVVSMVESYDRMREQLDAARAEIVRLKAATLTEREARAWARRMGFSGEPQESAVAYMLLAASRGDIPPKVRPACDECATTATKRGTTGTFCDAHADACTHAIDAVDVAHDPARVSLPRTTAAIEALPAPEREAYRRGVERGRYEALERPGGWVLVLEDGLRPAERARVAEFCRTVRGVAAALPVAEVTTIRRLARVSVELISARAENERSRRDVDRLTKLARALHRQRKDALDSVSPTDPPPRCEGCHKQTPTEAERLCVIVLVTDPENRVALIESAKPGRAWELPGGKVECNETARAAAVREIAEEIGLRLAEDALELAGIVHGTPKPGAAFGSVIHVFYARAEGELRPGSDAKGARWWTAAQVLVAKDLSDLDARDVLLAWAREQGGIQ